MVFEFKLPDIGEGIHEGEIVQWFVKEGDMIQADQKMLEAMTDKATVEITSPRTGRIAKINFKAGEIAKVGDVIVVIDDAKGGGAASAPVPESKMAPASAPTPPKASMAHPAPAAEAAAAAQEEKTLFDLPTDLSQSRRKKPAGPATATPVAVQQTVQVEHPAGRALAAPAVRYFARQQGIDINAVKGTGPGGRVLREDVQLALTRGPSAANGGATGTAAHAPTAPSLAPGATDERVPIRGLRKAIFENMQRSEAFAVPFTYWDEVDVTDLVKLRKDAQKVAETQGVKLSYLPFIVKAVVSGLKAYPHLNAWMDEEKRELVVKKEYHIGIAVATEKGLTVVVVKNADKKSIFEIGREIETLAEKARIGKASIDELKGSTFTITSLGKTGGLGATPVVNHPEVAILGVHKLEPRAMVDEKRQVVVRDCMNLSGTFDHRVIDGHVAAEFVQHVIRMLNQPTLLLLGTA